MTTNDFIIRPEKEEEYREVETRVRESFWNVYCPGCRRPDDPFFLLKELIPGYLSDVTGVYQTPQGYYVDDADVEAFDKTFPPKEKLKLPGQIFD